MQNKVVFSVTQINEYIKMTLESSQVLKSVFLRGEVSNFKSNYSSGHLYFSLKDESSSIRAVMFRGNASRLKFRLESGMKILAHGRISAYVPSGDCQIIIDDIEPDGAGALAVAFEQLKRRLADEGLFDESRKKPIPRFAKRVGVITSASGAAIHDIINVSGRRCPSASIIIYPSYVQGELAPRSLTGGILFFNKECPVDLIIIGRGGGSAEDLWCFNDEGLARAIASSDIPVISAVGHETDFTICDFVSDKRAPTPSAAAELAFFDQREVSAKFEGAQTRCEMLMSRKISGLKSKIDILSKSILALSPVKIADDKISKLAILREKLDSLEKDQINRSQLRFNTLCARLEGVNPLSIISRGYSVVENERGEIVSSVNDVEISDTVNIKLSDGVMRASVTEKKEN